MEGSQFSPACPSNKSNINMGMSMELSWNDNDREERNIDKEYCASANQFTIKLQWTNL
jgi:hypothetical protein